MQVLLSACLNPEDAPMEDALLRGKPGVHGQSETDGKCEVHMCELGHS